MSSFRTLALVFALAAPAPAVLAADPQEPVDLPVPEDLGLDHLEERRRAQLATRGEVAVRGDFGFTDRQPESGITFRHRIVDDAGLHYKPVHYDHGNGVAAADVDRDGLVDLYFTSQLGGNELWRNVGGGRFEQITAAAGVGLPGRVSVGASFADVDNDGDPDLYVTTVRGGNVLFVNDGKGRFTDATEGSGLAYSGHSSAGVFFDYDRDGLLDLFLANVGVFTTDERGRGGYHVGVTDAFAGHLESERTETSVLYRNLGGGRFEDVSEKTLLVDRSWSGDAVPVDVDGDGWQDLYVLNMQGDDHYWQNVGGRFFAERTDRLFPKTPWGSMGVAVFDWNRDGRFDLLITDMHSDMTENVGPEREKLKSRMHWSDEFLQGAGDNVFGNAFYEATEDGFREVSDRVGVENYWPWGVSTGDLDADGWEDVVIAASMNYPFRYGVNSVLLNQRGRRFADAEFLLGVEPRRTGATQVWFELDCPPLPEEGEGEDEDDETAAAAPGADAHDHGASPAAKDFLASAVGAAARHPHCEGRSGPVRVIAARGSRGSVLLDLDGDGDLDLVTAELNAEPQVLVSDLAQREDGLAWLTVELVGTRSNRDGLGAVVAVTTADGTQWQSHDGKSGYLAQSDLPLYFGLGGAERVERVEVRWPSGERQEIAAPPIGALLQVTEPAAAEE